MIMWTGQRAVELKFKYFSTLFRLDSAKSEPFLEALQSNKALNVSSDVV